LLAVLMTFGLLPLVAWGLSRFLGDEQAAGLLVAATTPCTLASAAVWTRRAGGNDAVALVVTIVTNGICFVVTPLWLAWMIGREIQIDTAQMTQKLGLLVVLPMAAAQLLRVFRPVGRWATRSKTPLGVLAQCGVLSMVFLGAIRTGMQFRESDGLASVGFELVIMLVLVLVVHTSIFFVGFGLAAVFRMSRGDRIAVGFAGSQKTLMVGLQVAMDAHASILPMISYHVGQLVIDTLIADRLRQTGQANPTVQAPASSPETDQG
jgi:sodium/bile acid cotransporter 7